MGEKGAKMTENSARAAEDLQNRLSGQDNILLKKMFGGHGIFADDKMFALVDKDGGIYFKVDESNLELYQDHGSPKHGRMPYYLVPEQILNDQKNLKEWAILSIAIARK